MKDKYRYVRLETDNEELFADFLPEDHTGLDYVKMYAMGVTDQEGTPRGAMVLEKDGSTLIIRSFRVDEGPDFGDGLKLGIFKTLIKFSGQKGIGKIVCRYTDDESRQMEKLLHRVGFVGFKEESVVYRIDAPVLGSLLKETKTASAMRNESVRIMEEKKPVCFSQLTRKETDLFSELYPIASLSFMIRKKRGVSCYVAVSELSDGTLYLSDIKGELGKEADLLGLLYMSLGNVFMRIHPDGAFYIAAVEKGMKNLADFFIAPLKESVPLDKIYVAEKIIEQKKK